MYEELSDSLARIEADPTIRVAVLRGAGGKAFVAGTDIEQFVGFSGDDGVAYEAKIDTYVAALKRVRVPMIAVVEGLAVGGGLAIANACDLRIAAAGARFGVPIARTLGNCLSSANLRRLTATLGLSSVKRMLLLADMPTAESLEPLGYLAAIASPETLDATVAQICQRLLGHAPVTMRVTREMPAALAVDPNTPIPTGATASALATAAETSPKVFGPFLTSDLRLGREPDWTIRIEREIQTSPLRETPPRRGGIHRLLWPATHPKAAMPLSARSGCRR
jgi:enoyl-CoA hydratase/carnithine racemase